MSGMGHREAQFKAMNYRENEAVRAVAGMGAIKLGVLLFGVVVAVAGVGCDKSPDPTAVNVPADNSKKNERDRDAGALTPTDQGENALDLSITQKIRQEVVKADALSMNAKNVKIITRDAVVTLRGPVKSEQERADIVAIATRVDGVKRVDNQLEIAAN